MRTVRAELLKLLTLPALALTAGLTWAVVTVIALLPRGEPVAYARIGFLVLGVLAATSEFDGQLGTTLLATPRRAVLLAAKLGALAAATAPVAAVTVLIGGGNPGELVLLTVFAAAVGLTVRNAPAAVVLLLGWFVVLTPLVDLPMVRHPWVAAAGALTFLRRDP